MILKLNSTYSIYDENGKGGSFILKDYVVDSHVSKTTNGVSYTLTFEPPVPSNPTHVTPEQTEV